MSRAEVLAFMADNVVCYATGADTCYAAEFFEPVDSTALDVTYAFLDQNRVMIARERVAWIGSDICVPRTALGITAIWTVYSSEREFRFDLSNALPMSQSDMIDRRAEFSATRTDKYCYGFYIEDGDLETLIAVVLGRGATSGTPVRLIPRALGSVAMGF